MSGGCLVWCPGWAERAMKQDRSIRAASDLCLQVAKSWAARNKYLYKWFLEGKLLDGVRGGEMS